MSALARDFTPNLLRRYTDPKTVTLRLEAEGCDRYLDTTKGSSGAVFRRSGDLDVRTLSGGSGWSVTNTAPGEWLEFDGVYFSAGNYQFIAKYSTSADSNRPVCTRGSCSMTSTAAT